MRHPPAAAIWLLARLAPSTPDSLLGDLEEEYVAGRSNGWYWRQVIRAIVTGSVKEVGAHPFLALRAVATGWIVLLVILALGGDLVAEATAWIIWGWTRHVGHHTSYWWPFHVTAAVVSYTGFALSVLAVVRLHRQHTMSMVLAYLCSVVVALGAFSAILDVMNLSVNVTRTLFYVVSWRSGLIVAPVVVLLAGLLGTAILGRSVGAYMVEKSRD